MLQNLSSAEVVIGALRVNVTFAHPENSVIGVGWRRCLNNVFFLKTSLMYYKEGRTNLPRGSHINCIVLHVA